MNELFVQRVRDVPLPQRATSGACAYDIVVGQKTTIAPGKTEKVPTGLIIKVPAGHALLVLPRSSTHKNFGLTFPHSVGLIDQDFYGPGDEIQILAHNTKQQSVTVQKGDRIAQLLLVPIATPILVETQFDAPTRGGFGSTGHA